jgi:hypothetical protein
MNRGPIFIAGPDRSGTSLMYAFLASHPNISMVRRTNMWRYFHRRYGDLSQPDNFERCLADMVHYNRMKHLKPDPERIRLEFRQGPPTYGQLFALFHLHHAERAGKPRWGDKSLHTEHYVDRVLAEYPEAKIIHMSRDPRDRYASVRKRHGKTVSRVGASMGRWLYSMKMAQRNQRRYPDNYLIVQYEALAGRPEETLRQVCAFIGEEYTPAMLTMSGAPDHRNTGGNSSFGRIEPGVISTRPVGRFREVLSAADVAFIQMWAGGDMKALGYSMEPVQFSPGRRLAFYFVELPLNLARMLGWLALDAIKIYQGESIPAHRLADKQLVPLKEEQ